MGICDRFHCLPSQVYEEGASILQLLQIEALGRPETGEGGEVSDGQ